MTKLILLFIAVCYGSWILNNPFPPKVNNYIIAVFVTLGIYKELRKLENDENT